MDDICACATRIYVNDILVDLFGDVSHDEVDGDGDISDGLMDMSDDMMVTYADDSMVYFVVESVSTAMSTSDIDTLSAAIQIYPPGM